MGSTLLVFLKICLLFPAPLLDIARIEGIRGDMRYVCEIHYMYVLRGGYHDQG
jgi:hypothetical protein